MSSRTKRDLKRIALSGFQGTESSFLALTLAKKTNLPPESGGLIRARSARASDGFVYLVGAGPGDPSLLTLRAAELLAHAEVVAYDSLIHPEILKRIHSEAILVPVGRRAHGTNQSFYRIHPDILHWARQGKTVVRLKAGDPFIFGRGGEEADELQQAGIPFEIVPGISSALGAAAFSGIPLTHRDFTSNVTFVSGHDLLSDEPTRTNWQGLARDSGTLVLFMASRKIRENLERLVELGRPGSTPAAFIAAATWKNQIVVTGTLSDLATNLEDKYPDLDRTLPGLIIVGEVVQLQKTLRWFQAKPLSGKKILVGRARKGASRIANQLRRLGALVTEIPRIETQNSRHQNKLEFYLQNINRLQGIIFTGLEAVRKTLGHFDIKTISRTTPLFAIGEPAYQELKASKLPVSKWSQGACVESLQGLAPDLQKGRFLLITAEGGRPQLRKDLKKLGVSFIAAEISKNKIFYPRTIDTSFDLIVLPSSSAARLVLESDHQKPLRNVPIVSIGPLTTAEAQRLGAQEIFQSTTDTIESVIQKTLEVLNEPTLSSGQETIEFSKVRSSHA